MFFNCDVDRLCVYVVFAAVGGTARWIRIELLGVVIFSTLALWLRAWLIAVGSAWHVFWDIALHLGVKPGAVLTPQWYPWLCVGFDLMVATVWCGVDEPA